MFIFATCTSSIVAEPTNPTPPEKTDAAIQGDIIDFQQFQNENDGHVQILVLFLNNSCDVCGGIHYGWMAHYMEGLQTPLLFYRMEVIFCWWW
jgi:hypothetical protein